MDELEQKLNSVLSNPQLMQQIMSMAQSMGAPPPQQSEPEPPVSAPAFDPKMLQAISGFAQQSGIDKNQRTLLNALHPYLSADRISRLEKAMRSAKMARLASSFLGQNNLLSLFGR